MRNTILTSCLLSGFLAAQGEATNEQRMAARDAAIDGELGFTFTNQYFFRGLRQEESLIFQPWLQLGVDVLDGDGDGGLKDLRVVVGQWNSLHDGTTGAAGGVWYESQFWTGLEATVGERWHFGGRYHTYTSPNGFGIGRPIQELVFTGRFDDKGVFDWLEGGLQPSLTLAIELVGQRDAGADRGIYAEIGLNPSFAIGKVGESEVTLSVPARLGLSLGDYYEVVGVGGSNDFFGFFQVGGVLSAPLNYLPASLGPWVGDVGLHLLVLGDNTDRVNGGDAAEILFTLGMSTVF